MPYIKLINETDNKQYATEMDLKNLLFYDMNLDKTIRDHVRANPGFRGFYMGCEPFLFPRDEEKDGAMVYQFFSYLFRVFPGEQQTLAMHRIVSFHPADLILPQDLDELGRKIALFYAAEGYIAAYAVHGDESCPHIHFCVSSVDYLKGNAFHLSFEYRKLESTVNQWVSDHEKRLDQDLQYREYRERALFGNPGYGRTSLFTKGQISINRKDYERYGHI